MGNDDKYKAVKLTITYADGHTEDFDTFIASVAIGLIPAGKEYGQIFYAPSEHFQTQGISHIYTTTDVIVGLVGAFNSSIRRMVEGMDEGGLMEILLSTLSLSSNEEEKYYKQESKIINPEEN